MAEDFATGKKNSLASGSGMADFRTGQNRRRTGIIGRFEDGGSGTFYRKSMPAPIAGSAPALNTFARKPQTQGVNFFTYGQSVRGGDQDLGGAVRGGDTNGGNDGFSGKATIQGFTCNISKGMSQYSDFGAGNGEVSTTADASYYRSGGGGPKFDTERYAEWMSGMVGTQGSNGASSGGGVLSNARQGVE
jgi:hypothetical protein